MLLPLAPFVQGIVLLVIATSGLVATVRIASFETRHPGRETRFTVAYRYFLPLAAELILALAALALLVDSPLGLYALPVFLTLMVIVGTQDAVDLLFGTTVAGRPLLGTGQPYALTIQAAAIQSDAELGGLPITRLAVTQRAGQSRLNFSVANPQSAELLQLNAEGATVEAGNLANANAAAISLKGDAASYRVDFGGALQRSTHVEISTRASSVELIVPASTAARISSASLLSDLEVSDGFSQQEGAFWTPAAAAADRPLLTIDASVEVGQLKLRLNAEENSGPRTQ
jgi:hypothetical protein